MASVKDAKLVANWIQGELLAQLNRDGREIEASPVAASALAELLTLLVAGKLSGKLAKTCFQAMFAEGISPSAWLEQHGGQITDEAEIARIVTDVLDNNPGQVTQYLDGKDKLVGFFVGRVMAATRGRANPPTVNAVVKRLLEDRR